MSHIKVILIALAGVLLLITAGVRADSLQLKNGNFVQGKYLGGTERAVQFAVNGKIRLYDINEILSISFASASADGGIPSSAADRKPGPSAPKSLAPKGSLISYDSRSVRTGETPARSRREAFCADLKPKTPMMPTSRAIAAVSSKSTVATN